MLHYNNIACTMCMLSSKSKLVHMVSLGSTRDKNSHHEYEVIKGGEKSISLRLEFYPTLILKYNDNVIIDGLKNDYNVIELNYEKEKLLSIKK